MVIVLLKKEELQIQASGEYKWDICKKNQYISLSKKEFDILCNFCFEYKKWKDLGYTGNDREKWAIKKGFLKIKYEVNEQNGRTSKM